MIIVYGDVAVFALGNQHRPTWLVGMAWHRRCDLASWVFWETKPFEGSVTTLANSSLASAYTAPFKQWYVVVISCNQQFI
jgi:hypothetical protein